MGRLGRLDAGRGAVDGRILVTEDGVFTAVSWWSLLQVSDLEVKLASDDAVDQDTFVIARGESQDEAERICRAISRMLGTGARRMEVATWALFAEQEEVGADIRQLTK